MDLLNTAALVTLIDVGHKFVIRDIKLFVSLSFLIYQDFHLLPQVIDFSVISELKLVYDLAVLA
jgi:hypothetical protein